MIKKAKQPSKKKRPSRKPKTEIAKRTDINVQEKEIIKWMDATGLSNKLHDDEKVQFLQMAKAFNLNPIKREIFCNVYYADDPERRTLSIVIGYRAFIKKAEHLKLLDGWGCVTMNEDGDMKAVCTIYRKDRKFPFVWDAWYKECYQTKRNGEPNSFWRKMPKFMLKKVCTAQAFRLCFPDEDMPYVQGENQEFDREYAEPINITPKEKSLEYEPDKIIDKKDKKQKKLTGKDALKKFITENQKNIMAAGIFPSDIFQESKGKTDEEIDKIIETVKGKI